MTNETTDTSIVLDTQGLICPEPIMLLHQAIRKANSGDCIHVLATDPSTQRDIPKFCTHLGHLLQKQTNNESVFEYWIVKK